MTPKEKCEECIGKEWVEDKCWLSDAICVNCGDYKQWVEKPCPYNQHHDQEA